DDVWHPAHAGNLAQLDPGLDVHVAGARVGLHAARGGVVAVHADVVVARVRLDIDRVGRIGDEDVDVARAGLHRDRARLAGDDVDVPGAGLDRCPGRGRVDVHVARVGPQVQRAAHALDVQVPGARPE